MEEDMDASTADRGGRDIICDGMICSILKAGSYMRNAVELVEAVEAAYDEKDVLEARRKMFTRF